MNKSKVDELYRAIRKTNYQKIYEICNCVQDGEVFSKEDINRLFCIYTMEWDYIEPWIYHKTQDMIFLSLIGEETEEKMEVFVKNIIEMILNYSEYVEDFFSMIESSFSEEEQKLFDEKIKKLGGESIINDFLKNGFDELERIKNINQYQNIKKYVEIEGMEEFVFTNSMRLEQKVNVDFLGDTYSIPIVINCKTKWGISDFLKSILSKFMNYLKENKSNLEKEMLNYYQKGVKKMAEEEGWLENYTNIYNTEELIKVIELVLIDIDDNDDDKVDFQLVFLCGWEEDNTCMIQINQNFEIDKIGKYC